MEPIRVLHVIDSLSKGGVESFIMNVYRKINKSKIQFDFLIRRNTNLYEKEISELGGKVYVVSEFPKRIIKNYLETQSVIMDNNYQIIHVHANSLLYLVPVIIGKKNKIPSVIMHSHSTQPASMYYLPIHKINSFYINKLTTKLYSCSNEAGQWMFGKNKYELVKNGIDLNQFSYNSNYNKEIRKEFSIAEDELVVGHVGRFVEAKNHDFIVDIFREVLKQKPKSKLILVGNGKLENKIKEKVKKYKIQDNVIFTGIRSDINNFLCAFDILLFPSLFEGLGVVLVEAQASGLNSLISDSIPPEVIILDNVNVMPLANTPEEWANELINFSNKTLKSDINEKLTKSGYNIETTVKQLENYYLSCIEKSDK
ncbi:glycosyltransferase family 1 protein [Ruoffia sp. FAM 26255]|uniref:glycosyltransferase family 1 protein n=1 Tax=Ruoffia sp. FAM 26255 TaxID=3259519 RepID=UPI003887C876